MISWIRSKVISANHAFFTRHGGVSAVPCDSLNFSGSLDLPENMRENRKRALDAIGMPVEKVSYLRQIHSSIVHPAKPGFQEGDALVTNEIGIPIAVSGADCFPVLFHDPIHQVIGAAHCGWKGTLNRISKNVITEMELLGANASDIRVAIGPGICIDHYEVSEELIHTFLTEGFTEKVYRGRNLDLAACVRETVIASGVPPDQIDFLNRCTYDPDFFSHRRDGGETGRLWSVIML